jgi:hypothetical protein
METKKTGKQTKQLNERNWKKRKKNAARNSAQQNVFDPLKTEFLLNNI